jgi:hypothetical protein
VSCTPSSAQACPGVAVCTLGVARNRVQDRMRRFRKHKTYQPGNTLRRRHVSSSGFGRLVRTHGSDSCLHLIGQQHVVVQSTGVISTGACRIIWSECFMISGDVIYPTGIIADVSVKRYPKSVCFFLFSEIRIIGWAPVGKRRKRLFLSSSEFWAE